MTDNADRTIEAPTMQVLQQEMHALRREVTFLSAEIRDMSKAFRAAQGAVAIIKWVGSLAIAVSAIVAAWKIGR